MEQQLYSRLVEIRQIDEEVLLRPKAKMLTSVPTGGEERWAAANAVAGRCLQRALDTGNEDQVRWARLWFAVARSVTTQGRQGGGGANARATGSTRE